MVIVSCFRKATPRKALAVEVGATSGRLVTVEDHWPEGGLGPDAVHASCRRKGASSSSARRAPSLGPPNGAYRVRSLLSFRPKTQTKGLACKGGYVG